MASNPSEDLQNLVLKGYEYFTGTIDFARMAADNNIINAEAARKRFKRFFAANGMNVSISGDKIVSDVSPNPPATPKRSAKCAASDSATPKTASKGSKRKAKADGDGSSQTPAKKQQQQELDNNSGYAEAAFMENLED